MPAGPVVQVAALVWYKELRRMWRSPMEVFTELACPIAVASMIVAVFTADKPSGMPEYEISTPTPWTQAGMGAEGELFYVIEGFNDSEVTSILTALYSGDAGAAASSATRFTSVDQMRDAIYITGNIDEQAAFTLVLNNTNPVKYTIQTSTGSLAQNSAAQDTVAYGAVSESRKLADAGVIDFQLKLAAALSGTLNGVNATIQRDPHPGNWTDSSRESNIEARSGTWLTIFPLWWSLSMLLPLLNTVRFMVRDGEYKLRQSLQVLGVGGSAYRASYALRNLLTHPQGCLFSMLLYQAVGAFYSSDLGSLWIGTALFVVQATSAAGFLAVFFRKGTSGPLVCLLLYGAGIGLGAYVALSAGSTAASLFSCLFPSSYLVVFVNQINLLENRSNGLRFSTVNESYSGSPSVGAQWLIVLLSIAIYEALAWYLEHVVPGVLGSTQAWNFPCLKLGTGRKRFRDCESGLANEAALLSARGLKKEFVGVKAVCGVDIDVYSGSVLSLLGHNGAGKTVTMSMLTGAIEASEGCVYFDGEPDNFDGLRNTLGVCPQHDILFDALTTQEHLYLVGLLKGVSLRTLHKDVSDALEAVDVTAKATARAASLSGGQKRKLSVAMAFLGGSRVVILDEPTAGMDPASRRRVWEVVERQKQGGCGIILTTHFMDEADVLGDHIAIMHKGLVKDSGTSLELKNRYGSGYSLIVVTDPTVDTFPVTGLVRRFVPAAQISSQCGGETVYQLPNSTQLPELLDAMTELGPGLGVTTHGLSMTTLEDVFLKLERESQGDDRAGGPRTPCMDVAELAGEPSGLMTAVFALLYKRCCCAIRDRQTLLFMFVFPALFVLAGILVREIVTPGTVPPDVHTLAVNDTFFSGLLVGTSGAATRDAAEALFNHLPNSTKWVTSSELSSLIHPGAVSKSNGALNISRLDTVTGGAATFAAGNMLYNATSFYALPAMTQLFAFGAGGILAEGTIMDMPENPYAVKMTGDMIFAMGVAIGLTFIPSSYASFVVREKETGARDLQYAAGVSKLQYWATTAIFDMVWTLLSMSVFALLLMVVVSKSAMSALYASMLLYGLTASFLAYVASFLFKEYSKAQITISLSLAALAFSFVISDLAVSATEGPGSTAALVVAVVFAAINPVFGITKCSMLAIDFMGSRTYFEDEYDTTDLFNYNLMGRYHFIFAVQLGSFAVLLFLLELPFKAWSLALRRCLGRVRRHTMGFPDASTTHLLGKVAGGPGSSDFGVSRERTRVQAMKMDESADRVVVQGLQKEFKRLVAVEDVWLGIGVGCFGLLGSNGAGKTTLIKMLTCEVPPTAGAAQFQFEDGARHGILTNGSAIRKRIGLCPQFDAHLGEMTGREMLKFFALLKGLPWSTVPDFIALVGLQSHADRPCGTYSGGNKRKLSVALALMGRPDVVFLDEPSTGVDPKARRVLWDVIKEVAKTRTVVLTSHSMEEVDALSTRIGVMKQGRLRCVGAPQELRSTLSCGYAVRVATPEPELLERAIIELFAAFPGSAISERHRNHAVIGVPLSVPPSAILRYLQNHAASLGITDYAVSQTTLEQVFLNIVSDASAPP